jgi:hypothetical protein
MRIIFDDHRVNTYFIYIYIYIYDSLLEKEREMDEGFDCKKKNKGNQTI